MKILIYLEPWVEKGRPQWKQSWVPIFEKLVDTLTDCGVETYEFVFILGDAQIEALSLLVRDNVRLCIVDQSELLEIFDRPEDAQAAWFAKEYSTEQMRAMQSLMAEKLEMFEPDVVWSFVSPVPFLELMFPSAMVIYQELGMLGRRPFPISWYLDPWGTFSNSYLAKYADELHELELSPAQVKRLGSFRRKYQSLISDGQPFSKRSIDPQSLFSALVLVPLQYSKYFVFDSMCDYRSQFEYLIDVLEKVPRSIGVVVTQHVNPIAERVIDTPTAAYLSDRYPNFIYRFEFERYDQASLLLLDVVDGVIGVSSTVAQQALLFDKPIFTEANSQLTPLAQKVRLEDLDEFFVGYPMRSRDAIFYHLLTHYYIPEGPYFHNGAWLTNRLRRMLDKFRNNDLEFGFFELVDDENKLFDFYNQNALPLSGRKQDPSAVAKKGSPPQRPSAQPVGTSRQQILALQQEIEALRNSTSWRITKFLRFVGEKIKSK